MAIRGGARAGAGRPRNKPNKTSALREQRIAESGMTPLDIMIDNMRVAYQNALNSERELKNIQIEGLNSEDAFKALLNAVRGVVNYRKIAEECARDAAPFVHPRLAQIEHSGEINTNSTELADAVLTHIARRGGNGAVAAEEDTPLTH